MGRTILLMWVWSVRVSNNVRPLFTRPPPPPLLDTIRNLLMYIRHDPAFLREFYWCLVDWGRLVNRNLTLDDLISE